MRGVDGFIIIDFISNNLIVLGWEIASLRFDSMWTYHSITVPKL
jgi:hypothetical protein